MIDALIGLTDRYADEARRQGRDDVAETLARVPRYPARGFREALQFLRIINCLSDITKSDSDTMTELNDSITQLNTLQEQLKSDQETLQQKETDLENSKTAITSRQSQLLTAKNQLAVMAPVPPVDPVRGLCAGGCIQHLSV